MNKLGDPKVGQPCFMQIMENLLYEEKWKEVVLLKIRKKRQRENTSVLTYVEVWWRDPRCDKPKLYQRRFLLCTGKNMYIYIYKSLQCAENFTTGFFLFFSFYFFLLKIYPF